MAAFEAKYPLRQMDPGDWFFLPDVTKDMTRYFTKRGVALGMQFKVERLAMVECGDSWHEPASDLHASWGVKVTRVV